MSRPGRFGLLWQSPAAHCGTIQSRQRCRTHRIGWLLASGTMCVFTACSNDAQQSPAPEPTHETAATSSARAQRDAARELNLSRDAPAQTARPLFTDITAETGIDFSFHSGRNAGEFAILESLGGGVAAFDYDADGHRDLMFAGGGTLADQTVAGLPCGLFQNRGKLKFHDVTDVAGVTADAFYNHGIFPGDFNADGFADLAVSGYGGVQLFRNQGDGTFVRFDLWQTDPQHPWSSSLAWGDFNHDGLLDLYVAHYVDWSWRNHPVCPGPPGVEREVCPPREFHGISDALYLNRDRGRFERVNESVGLVDGGKGLGVVAGDINLDGHLDLYVANDTTDNFLYWNDGHGQLEESGMISGAAADEVGVNTGSMGVCLQDFDNDGQPDLWVTNFERELFGLYHNEKANLFSHVSRGAGLAGLNGLYVGFGTVFVDFDFDGDRDLVAANGHVSYASPHAPFRQLPLLLENQRGKRFTQRNEPGYFATGHTGRGLASVDLDNDGGTDFAVSHLEEPVSVLRGLPPPNERWATVRLVGRQSNRDAIGASISRETETGMQRWMCNSGGSYLSQSDRRIRLALPPEGTEAKFTVHWPGGNEQTFACPKEATHVVWVEGHPIE